MSTVALRPRSFDATLLQVAHATGAHLTGDGRVVVSGIHHDSRHVEPGDVFVARKGERADGLLFVDQAILGGAAAVLVERGHEPSHASVPVLRVDDIRLAIGQVASLLYGDPTSSLKAVGITGTNGKTTTSYLLQAALDGAGKRTGVLGTLGARVGELRIGGEHTTPEADEVMRIAALMRDEAATHLVMEVSSHALAQRRADAVRFDVAAYTNLTVDHLDYHGTLEAYAAAKKRLFFDLHPRVCVVMVDDRFGQQLADDLGSAAIRVSRNPDSSAEVRPESQPQHDAQGIRCSVQTPTGLVSLQSTLVGEHNLSNLLLTLGIVAALDEDVDRACQALSARLVVPGRLERCDGPDDDILVLVDYAHTPDALERALTSLRRLTSGRLFCVFGCGGDRDRTKRPMMGDVAGRLADIALVTNDNPRSEPPETIAQHILEGLRGRRAEVVVELERQRAIETAIEVASTGDVVLIAGKGHEPYQIIGSQVRHFDDREEARRALAVRRLRRAAEGDK